MQNSEICGRIGSMKSKKEMDYRRANAKQFNLRVHHSKQVSQWVEDHKDEIALFYLPPYSPEYNPDEYLNNALKRSLGTQAMVQNVRELEANTAAFMGRISEDSDHVKSYFDHPALDRYKFD